MTFIQELTKAGLAVFPLRDGNDTQERKKPAVEAWQFSLPLENQELVRYGIALTHDWIVIDHDAYKQGAEDSFEELCNEYGLERNTFICRSGRGGKHYWYRNPTGRPIRKKLSGAFGIDFLSHGCYVVGPGTDSYTIINGGLDTAAAIPEALLAALEKESDIRKQTELDGRNYEGYQIWLESQPPATQGQSGDDATYRIIARARDFGVRQEDIQELLHPWNETCEPPWSRAELEVKIGNVYKYGQNALGSMAANNTLFETPAPSISNLVEKHLDSVPLDFWDLLPNGKLKPSVRNLKELLGLDRFGAVDHPDINFKDLFLYNEFTRTIEFKKKPFWRKKNDLEIPMLADKDILAIKIFFIDACRVEFTQEAIREGVEYVAHRNSYHPIRNYLNTLVWDGNLRLQNLFTQYFNFTPRDAADDLYRRTLGKAFILAAIYRIMHPGCKWDNAIVLAGPQGLGKSPFVRILGSQNWSAAIPNLNMDTNGMMAVASTWFLELPEISAVKKVDVNQFKAFLSMEKDTFRPPYGRCIVHAPRQCVFVWTLNPIKGQAFLMDETGGRRFWIVDVPNRIDLESIEQNRDQLFAEAMDLYKQGIHPETLLNTIQDTAKKYQRENTIDSYDPLLETVKHYIDMNWSEFQESGGQKQISYTQIFEGIGLFDKIKIDHRLKIRIGRIMDDLGWIRRREATERWFVKDCYDI